MNPYQTCRAINDRYRTCRLEVGDVVQHPDGYKVKIMRGCYYDPVYGRVSNYWWWKRVLPDGSLAEEEEGGYGWDTDP